MKLEYLIAGILSVFVALSSSSAQTYDATLYVDLYAGTAPPAGAADGSQESPFASISEAVQHAVYVYKRHGQSTEILVAPGVYRESVNFSTFTNHENNQPSNTQPIVIQAEDPAQRPVLSGADVWTHWDQAGAIFQAEWTYDWGVTDIQFGGAELADIVGRREMVFVNGLRLAPVASRDELVPGSFAVDEGIDSLFVYPPFDVDFPNSLVEVSVRDHLWTQDFEDNVTIRNLVFENAADPWIEGMAGVRITSSDHLTVEDCTFRSNNWTGLIVSQSSDVVLRRLDIIDNGGRGMALWRLKNALVEDSETSHNNWRGFLDLFTGWTVGNNIDSSHDITIRRHTATDNFARGLWFDSDIVNGVLEESVLRDNKNDGLFIEAAQGPVYVRNNLIVDNGRDGIFSGNTEKLHITGNVIRDNLRAAIRLSGRNEGRNVEDFETGQRYVVEALDWVIRDNRLSGSGPYLMGTTVDEETWSNFLATLDSDNNDWCHPAFGAVFQVAGGALKTIDQWRALTGQDLSSTYCNPGGVGSATAEAPTSFSVSRPYPNPANSFVFFDLHAAPDAAITVDVFDVLGRRIAVAPTWQTTDALRLDVSRLPVGIYHATVRHETASGERRSVVRPFLVGTANR